MILLLAFSARMLADLAVREGHEVVALDHFGDLDLRRRCPSVSVRRGGMAALVAAAGEIRAPSVVYGAGLENRPDLVARLGEGRALLGCTPETLRRVRDPALLAASGLPYPRTLSAREARPRSGRWLRKPLRSGGGRGVREWRGGPLGAGAVVQERIAGLACSAAAVADGRFAVLLGVSEQLIGERAFGARGYAWCGNVVPPRLPAAERRALADRADAICARLAAAFGLRGVFGVDLVWDGERAWLVEVNPRPTGSLETLAAVHGVRPFTAHLEGCAGRLPSPPAAELSAAAGKAILFATEDVRVPDTNGWPERGIRDVPHPGERIAARRPVCTLIATGPSPASVLADLEARAAALRAELRVEAHAVA